MTNKKNSNNPNLATAKHPIIISEKDLTRKSPIDKIKTVNKSSEKITHPIIISEKDLTRKSPIDKIKTVNKSSEKITHIENKLNMPPSIQNHESKNEKPKQISMTKIGADNSLIDQNFEEIEQTTNFDDNSSLNSNLDEEIYLTADTKLKIVEINSEDLNILSKKDLSPNTPTAKVLSNYHSKIFNEKSVSKASLDNNKLNKAQNNEANEALNPKKNEEKVVENVKDSAIQPQTEAEHDKVAGQAHQLIASEEKPTSSSPVLRILKTNPPPQPHVVESKNKSKKSAKNIKLDGVKETAERHATATSITGVIRDGKVEKPIRSKDKIPPPPPAKPSIIQNNNQMNFISNAIVDLIDKKTLKITPNIEDALTKPSAHVSSDTTKTVPDIGHVRKLVDQSVLQDQQKLKIKQDSNAKKQQRIIQDLEAQIKAQQQQAVLIASVNNKKNKEEKFMVLTNLPQLDKIDYIFKTNDEK